LFSKYTFHCEIIHCDIFCILRKLHIHVQQKMLTIFSY
jgi:hypothetical protein